MALWCPWMKIFVSVLIVFKGVDGVVIANNGNTANGGSHSNANELVKHRMNLFITPPPPNPQNVIVKRVDETLSLTCTIKYNDTGDSNRSLITDYNEDRYKLSWYLPVLPQNSKHRTSTTQHTNALTLEVKNLKESDTGEYECEARSFMEDNTDLILTKSVTVNIKPRKNGCGDSSFVCSTGECIPKRFVCDGRNDCKDGSDENGQNCGSDNPCEGKLRCDDGRCISRQACCDKLVDTNCTTRVSPPCCKQILPIQFNVDLNQYTSQSQQFNDMGFLQTTIYTVIGCAMAFMFIITIMVIAICRVHLKRTSLSRYPHPLNQSSQRQDSWGNIFLHTGGGNLPYTSAASGLLVTYNINNGVQFVGRPVNPPPYSEIMRSPPREGPPPPYASEENIASSSTVTMSSSLSPVDGTCRVRQSQSSAHSTQNNHPSVGRRRTVYTLENDPDVASTTEPLLSDNNNGDINGNSTSEVQVQPNINLRSHGSDEPTNNVNLSDCQI